MREFISLILVHYPYIYIDQTLNYMIQTSHLRGRSAEPGVVLRLGHIGMIDIHTQLSNGLMELSEILHSCRLFYFP